eukprot:TRINITY_DN12585_c0_g1_i1.p1 TRINITY_DN12585_c0_g1~~TRINITY_DN12585_c0_g1_i1.p1  ORF type:complete len:625 (-),score=153.22 TRINITY_DN12585_c0_g1_i1:346-2220(-)
MPCLARMRSSCGVVRLVLVTVVFFPVCAVYLHRDAFDDSGSVGNSVFTGRNTRSFALNGIEEAVSDNVGEDTSGLDRDDGAGEYYESTGYDISEDGDNEDIAEQLQAINTAIAPNLESISDYVGNAVKTGGRAVPRNKKKTKNATGMKAGKPQKKNGRDTSKGGSRSQLDDLETIATGMNKVFENFSKYVGGKRKQAGIGGGLLKAVKNMKARMGLNVEQMKKQMKKGMDMDDGEDTKDEGTEEDSSKDGKKKGLHLLKIHHGSGAGEVVGEIGNGIEDDMKGGQVLKKKMEKGDRMNVEKSGSVGGISTNPTVARDAAKSTTMLVNGMNDGVKSAAEKPAASGRTMKMTNASKTLNTVQERSEDVSDKASRMADHGNGVWERLGERGNVEEIDKEVVPSSNGKNKMVTTKKMTKFNKNGNIEQINEEKAQIADGSAIIMKKIEEMDEYGNVEQEKHSHSTTTNDYGDVIDVTAVRGTVVLAHGPAVEDVQSEKRSVVSADGSALEDEESETHSVVSADGSKTEQRKMIEKKNVRVVDAGLVDGQEKQATRGTALSKIDDGTTQRHVKKQVVSESRSSKPTTRGMNADLLADYYSDGVTALNLLMLNDLVDDSKGYDYVTSEYM